MLVRTVNKWIYKQAMSLSYSAILNPSEPRLSILLPSFLHPSHFLPNSRFRRRVTMCQIRSTRRGADASETWWTVSLKEYEWTLAIVNFRLWGRYWGQRQGGEQLLVPGRVGAAGGQDAAQGGVHLHLRPSAGGGVIALFKCQNNYIVQNVEHCLP